MARTIQEIEGTEDGITDADLIEAIVAAEERLQKIEKQMEKYKSAYKSAKEVRDDELKMLRKFTGARLEKHPLLDAAKDAGD